MISPSLGDIQKYTVCTICNAAFIIMNNNKSCITNGAHCTYSYMSGMYYVYEVYDTQEREGALIYEPLIYLIYIVQTKYIPLIYENVRPHFLI